MLSLRTNLLVLTACLMSACASVLQGDSQSVQVTTYCGPNAIPASCIASNTKGSWPFYSPAQIVVHKDLHSLSIRCKSPYFAESWIHAPSSPSPMLAGNLILGGVVGAGVDLAGGAGFSYNPVVNIFHPSCR